MRWNCSRWESAITPQTLLRQLESKGAVAHEAKDRTFVFFPRLKEDKVKRMASRELLERVFGGRAGSLVAHLIKNETISRAELDEIHGLIDHLRKD
jgi:BlaI family penicillinase repressor